MIKKFGLTNVLLGVACVIVAGAASAVVVNKKNERSLCSDFAKTNKETLSAKLTPNKNGYHVFNHPEGHTCKVAPYL